MQCPKEILLMWDMVKESMLEENTATFCDLWYGDLIPESFDDTGPTLTLLTTAAFKQKVLESKHKEKLETKFSSVCRIQNILLR